MRVYLIRHGDYTFDLSQKLDVLSDKGKSDITQLAHLLKPLHLSVSAIWHSDKQRAKQTAQLLAAGFICGEAPLFQPGLAPDDDAIQMAERVKAQNEDLLLVGHLPFMGKLVSQLILDRDDRAIVDFDAGTLACLQADAVGWKLKWVLSPDLWVERG